MDVSECKQEDGNMFRTCGDGYTACSNGNMKQPDVIIIDDEDDLLDDTSRGSQNNTSVLYSTIIDLLFDQNNADGDNGIETLSQNEFLNEDVSLEGVISVRRCGDKEYIFVENGNFEIKSMQQSITTGEVPPLKIKNVICCFRSLLLDQSSIEIQNHVIKVSTNYKTFIACLVFLLTNYHYFFETISENIEKLAQIVFLHLNARMLCAQMIKNASKLNDSEIKKRAMEEALQFIKTDMNKYSLQFSHLFVQIIQKFEYSKPLPPFYQTLFSLIVFERIVYFVCKIEPASIKKDFIAIRFIMVDLLSCAGSHENIIKLLMKTSHMDFVNNFNIVATSFKVIHMATKDNYFSKISGANSRVQSPLMPNSNTLGNSNTTNSIFNETHSMAEVMNMPHISLHPDKRILLPRSNDYW